MHSVKRVRQSKEAIEARKAREQAKIKEFLALNEDILSRKKNKDWSKEALDLTTRMLQINPEFYTMWNYRRNILLNGIFANRTPQEINELLSDDLSLTTVALKVHPKVYWIWNHRRWCLEHVPDGPGTDTEGDPRGWRKSYWDKEMFVVEKMLDADPRNFQAWNYRRYVLASMPVPRSETSELAYTTKKIESNFSNFSAWHQRSKTLTSLWDSGRLDPVKSKEDEFELVRNAMFTDPDDQSVWLYHRWLIGSGDDKMLLENEIAVIQELLDEQPDSKWCLESIVHYKRLLVSKHGATTDTARLTRDCHSLLEQLIKLDPARRNRYREIGA
ncbi:rab-protein geranylgeranyltransferase [Armillaria novae-zelandiae]|uniref:Geranylgeranyl transferase type-2 subunit alpha n=1 Tax=Armillaria novae-zelandiae TaxID=153914 RepID=A0AA39PH75_9AGAR|nr:rab-protein geranylgeranyltransferase [Armillaria novae-zelandiae]